MVRNLYKYPRSDRQNIEMFTSTSTRPFRKIGVYVHVTLTLLAPEANGSVIATLNRAI